MLTVEQINMFSSFNIASSKSLPLNYIYCPKNACSSLKLSFLEASKDENLREEYNPHEAFQSTFCNGSVEDPAKPFLVVTRNPFSRFLSAYVEKISAKTRTDHNVWPGFCKIVGINENVNLSMTDFLKILLQLPINAIDPHFRPQYILHNYYFLKPAFIGTLESMNETRQFMADFGIEMLSYRPHSVQHKYNVKQLSTQDAELIIELYSRDFIYYGYDSDPMSSRTPLPKKSTQELSLELSDYFLASQKLNADDLREASLKLESKGNILEAFRLMKVALMMRPSGPFIQAKAREFQSILGI